MAGASLRQHIRPDPGRIGEICRRYHVKRLALFGSVLREDFGSASDVDVLVEFETGRVPGLAFFSLQHDLTQAFDRAVDLNMPEDLPAEFRDDVLRAARVQYESGSVIA